MSIIDRIGRKVRDWWQADLAMCPVCGDQFPRDRMHAHPVAEQIDSAVQANRAHCGARHDSVLKPGSFYICTLTPDHDGPMHECWSASLPNGPRASWPVESNPIAAVGEKVDADLATVTELGDLADAIRDMDPAALDHAFEGMLDDFPELDALVSDDAEAFGKESDR
ncbi:hypothetical protein [Isoptericola sp. NPDC056605]|uniref:hypothetical protein n=1 Tax=Isoptericola sp. NPDC056605 TaxID=3345876 RepID=UPI0036C7C624